MAMNEPLLTVVFYKTHAGNEPVRDWLLSLSLHDRKMIGTDIKTVQFGWPMGMPIVRKIENGLWEIRTNGLSFGIARTFFTIVDKTMVLFHGMVKKTQKTPQDDIDLARKRLSEVIG